MHLVPTEDEVVRILRETGGLRDGHFLYPSGLHSNEYLQVPLAMRYSQHARTLSVGLSRLLRANPEIRTLVPELSIVAPAPAGLPTVHSSLPTCLPPLSRVHCRPSVTTVHRALPRPANDNG
jgi:orotate phosphoribosyltransferase